MKPIFKFEPARIKKTTVENIFEFSEEVTTNLQHKNTQRDMTSNNFDVNFWKYTMSKIAEYGVCTYLLLGGLQCTLPDMNIYPNGDAGHDLMCTGSTGVYKVHVKYHTKGSEKQFEKAWQFSTDDPLISNPGQFDIIVLTSPTPNEEDNVDIVKIVRATDVAGHWEHVFNKEGEWNPYKSKLTLRNLENNEIPDFKIV